MTTLAPADPHHTRNSDELVALGLVDRGEIRFWLDSIYRYQHGGYHRRERAADSTAPGMTSMLEDQTLYERLSNEGLITVATQVHPFNHVVLTAAGQDVLHTSSQQITAVVA